MKPRLLSCPVGWITLLLLIFSIWLAGLCPAGMGRAAEGSGGGGPDIVVSSVYGNLDQGRPCSIFVALKNRAESTKGFGDLDLRREDARSIVAELISSEEEIRVLSRPQMGGLLRGEESVTLQFTALAEGVPLGVYPLLLRCNYSRLAEVTARGEESAPDLSFDYRSESIDLPIQTDVVRGARIEIEGPEGWWERAAPGREAGLELTVRNRGDEPALGLQLEVRPSPPILMVENRWTEANLSPEERAQASLALFVDENASPGNYALPCLISYQDGPEGEERREEAAAVVYVAERPDAPWIFLIAGALALLILLGGGYALARARGSRRRFRLVKA